MKNGLRDAWLQWNQDWSVGWDVVHEKQYAEKVLYNPNAETVHEYQGAMSRNLIWGWVSDKIAKAEYC